MSKARDAIDLVVTFLALTLFLPFTVIICRIRYKRWFWQS
jgi:hypothetical protein